MDFEDDIGEEAGLGKIEESKGGLHPALNSALLSKSAATACTSRSNTILNKEDRRTTRHLRSSVKVNLRNTETALRLKNLALLSK